MTVSQTILLGLIVITTLGAWAESITMAEYRLTFGRAILALIVPCLWASCVIFSPWGEWLNFKFALASPWRELLSLFFTFLGTLLIFVIAPAGFVMTVIIWVSAALSGNLIDWIAKPLLGRRDSTE